MLSAGGVHQLIGVQDQGHGAIVDGFHLHIGAEAAVLRGIAQLFADGQELFVQGIAQLGTGSIGKAGAAALAAVAVEGELADHQHFAADGFQS